jgi:asparagine synthase (glutamine-hydrolysing)
MCGIVGFLDPAVNSESTQVIQSMMDSIKHRGPDDQNHYVKPEHGLAFGHVRLSIIDISNGAQPMFSPDGRYVMIYNGEVYNFLELRQLLHQKGHKLKTYSDTEVILHMYMEFGKDMLNQLNGMFSFAIYDHEERTTFIARDHFGVKPFYYYQKDNFFAFGSEIKALLKHPKIQARRNDKNLHEYLTFQMILGNESLFDNIHKLEPAHYMVVKDGKIIENKEYWKPEYNIDENKTEEEFADELLLLLQNSLSIQIRSDVPLGAYLSGGIDSSLVSVLASKFYFGQLKTFTGGFKLSQDYDETRYAKIVSDSINSHHFEIFPEAHDFTDTFEKLVYHMDEPGAGPGLFPQFMVSKLAAEQVKVVLGGQGGDEIFGGYARYAVAYLEQCLKGAIFESQEEGSHVVTLNSIIENLPMLKQYLPMMKNQFAGGMFDAMDKRYYRLIDRSPNLHKMYDGDFLNQRNEENIAGKFEKIFNDVETSSYFNKMTYYDMKTLLPSLLQVEDRVSMAVSLESRVPILDRRIVELAASMPPTMKFAGGRTKHMLIESVKNVLPKEIINRKDKMGFPTPLNEWIAGPIKEYVLDILHSQAARERGMYKLDDIEKSLHGSPKFSRDLWGMLNVELWHRTFIDN